MKEAVKKYFKYTNL